MRPLAKKQIFTPRHIESLDMYHTDIRRYCVLNPEEELSLVQRIQDGDKKAKEKLICHNLRFVETVAKMYQTRDVQLTDIIQDGNMGLITAAERFDPAYGVRFISYAIFHIRQAIQNGLLCWGNQMRLPETKQMLLRQMGSFEDRFFKQYGYYPADKEVAEAFQVDVSDIRRLQSFRRGAISIDSPVGEDGDATLGCLIVDINCPEADAGLDRESLRKCFSMMLDELSQSERDVICLYYGIGHEGGFNMTNEQIADRLGVSRECIRRTLIRAIDKLQKSHLKKTLREICA